MQQRKMQMHNMLESKYSIYTQRSDHEYRYYSTRRTSSYGFLLFNEIFIRQFTCALVVVDAKVRKMWIFCTPGKRPPLATVKNLLEQLKQMGRQVVNIRAGLGGELVRSSEFYELLVKQCQCGLQTTGGYSS